MCVCLLMYYILFLNVILNNVIREKINAVADVDTL